MKQSAPPWTTQSDAKQKQEPLKWEPQTIVKHPLRLLYSQEWGKHSQVGAQLFCVFVTSEDTDIVQTCHFFEAVFGNINGWM